MWAVQTEERCCYEFRLPLNLLCGSGSLPLVLLLLHLTGVEITGRCAPPSLVYLVTFMVDIKANQKPLLHTENLLWIWGSDFPCDKVGSSYKENNMKMPAAPQLLPSSLVVYPVNTHTHMHSLTHTHIRTHVRTRMENGSVWGHV